MSFFMCQNNLPKTVHDLNRPRLQGCSHNGCYLETDGNTSICLTNRSDAKQCLQTQPYLWSITHSCVSVTGSF